MADRNEGDDDTTNETIPRVDELPDNSANEEVPTSLETIVVAEANTAKKETLDTVTKDKAKVDILLKATGNAPIMKQKKWSVSQDNHIGRISEFMRRYLKLDPGERLFLYVNQTFAPAPDQTVKNLYDCYGADGKLIIHYCKSQAWG